MISLRIFSLASALALAGLLPAPATAAVYVIHSEKSRVRFEVGHHDYAKPVKGRFENLAGEIRYDPGSQASDAEIHVVIDADSIDTANSYRDGHLREAFFETNRFPEIQFRATGIDPANHVVLGQLTMKGVTRDVALEVTNVREFTDATGMHVLRCRASGTINRRNFGIAEDASRAEGMVKLVASVQEALDEFIEDDVEISISLVAYAN